MSLTGELASLFLASFLFGTLLPGSSEAALAATLKLGTAPPAAAIAIAAIGNTLAGIVNWTIGRFGARFRDHPRFPLTPSQFERCRTIYARYGVWSLLFSWLPVIGDPLTVAAGLMQAPFRLFLPLMAIGKLMRYLAVAGVLSLI
ncbi:MAG: YqaA family protein [Beijerinckiaceae bacterium]